MDSANVEQLRRRVSVSDVAADYGVKLTRDGDEWVALCPFHNEKTPSFTVFRGSDGVERFHCFGCGEKGDVLDFVQKIKGVDLPEAKRILGGGAAPANVAPKNIEPRDSYAGIEPVYTEETIAVGQRVRLYNPKRAGSKMEWGVFRPELVHTYCREDSSLVGYVLRRGMKDGGKETPMVMRVRLPSGEECWSRFPFPKPRPLYGLDLLRDGQVIVVEGEKCADALRSLTKRNIVSWAGGTQGVKHTDWSPLHGRDVIIWPDADEPGHATALEISSLLNGKAARVRIIDVSGYSDGWDVADAIADGWDRGRVIAFMKERVGDAPSPAPEPAPEPELPAVIERDPSTPPVGVAGMGKLMRPVLEVEQDSDVFLGRLLAKMMESACEGPTVKADGDIWAYGPTAWDRVPYHSLEKIAQNFDLAGVVWAKKQLKLSDSKVKGILNQYGIAVSDPEFFSNPTEGMNVLNGTIVLDDDGIASIRPHDPADKFRFTIDAEYNPRGGELPEGSYLHKLIHGAFADDPDRDDKIALVGEILGAAAFGMATRVKQPKAFVFLGETANNGKSTIAGLISCLLPNGSVSSISPESFSDDKKIVHLAGKAANVADELSAGAIAGEVFKAAITGNPIQGRDVYRSAVSFRPRALHCFTTNVLPRFSGGIDRGLRRRLVVLTFMRVIPENEVIPDILERIKSQELDLLLEFAVAGAQRLKRNGGYTIPSSSSAALEDWLLLDPVNEWFDQRVIVVHSEPPGGWKKTRDLYDDFKKWAVDNGHADRFLPPVNTFSQRIKTLPNVQLRRHAGGRIAMGIALNDGYTFVPRGGYANDTW